MKEFKFKVVLEAKDKTLQVVPNLWMDSLGELDAYLRKNFPNKKMVSCIGGGGAVCYPEKDPKKKGEQ